jgi:spore germination cell wall hydrolase CwlJ-like protein
MSGWLVLAATARADDWRILDPSPEPAPAMDQAVVATPSAVLDARDQVAPFVLPTDSAERDRALECLTAAIYYEAATEPREGQEAVAQVVLNRLRHPAYPKSVCGVVYDGVGTAATCQFTFACDGSTSRRPVARLWENARAVADAALSGHVASRIGAATHYHAASVSPYWRNSLTPVGQIGNHLFYRMPGWQGTAAALTGLYSNDEPPPPPPARGTALAARASRPPPPGEKSVDFTVWGLKMATISVRHGRIDVKSAS